VALCLIESYAITFAAIYVWKLVGVVPIMLHERDEDISQRGQTIHRLESAVRKAVYISAGYYSIAQLATLVHLTRQGDELFQQSAISLNQANPRGQRDDWMKKHDKWRHAILAILRARDAEIFLKPIFAGYDTQGLKGAIDQIHGNRRGQILEQMERLKGVLERNRD
jgi:hypothetical protein